MVLTEFVLTQTTGKSPIDWQYFAAVSVTTGFLWWKRTERRNITREYAGFWHFVDSGKSCPGFQAEELERSYRARELLQAVIK